MLSSPPTTSIVELSNTSLLVVMGFSKSVNYDYIRSNTFLEPIFGKLFLPLLSINQTLKFQKFKVVLLLAISQSKSKVQKFAKMVLQNFQ